MIIETGGIKVDPDIIETEIWFFLFRVWVGKSTHVQWLCLGSTPGSTRACSMNDAMTVSGHECIYACEARWSSACQYYKLCRWISHGSVIVAVVLFMKRSVNDEDSILLWCNNNMCMCSYSRISLSSMLLDSYDAASLFYCSIEYIYQTWNMNE